MNDFHFWRGKRVFITGHTGFKGTWLSLWLRNLGAEVSGFSLEPPTTPSICDLTGLERKIHSVRGDIRRGPDLARAMREAAPDVSFHLAAQPLVLDSYKSPIETFNTNVMGTANFLEAVRETPSVRAVVVVTTDKCYENREWLWGYREGDPLGGHDPYSSSKACAELVVASYRNSFFSNSEHGKNRVGIASARAGNVIGGGDFAKDRLIPDAMRALASGETLSIRRPKSIRPWQHVLEAVAGYLILAEKLFIDPETYSVAWNFGPADTDAQSVEWIVSKLRDLSGGKLQFKIEAGTAPHEAGYLKLDTSRARTLLPWQPHWSLTTALRKILFWHESQLSGKDVAQLTLDQIAEYSATHAV